MSLYPSHFAHKVVLASWYRTYTGLMDFFSVPTKMCWSINRGEGLAPVDSCEGIGGRHFCFISKHSMFICISCTHVTHTDVYTHGLNSDIIGPGFAFLICLT